MRRDLGRLDERALTLVAGRLAPAVAAGGVLYLVGELGAGKTTFARALLRALGVGERVKSPTYSLVESYRVGALDVHHLDLYRIADPGELEWLGLGELAGPGALLVVEWPERGTGALPQPDVVLRLSHAGPSRALAVEARSPRGASWMSAAAPGCPDNPE